MTASRPGGASASPAASRAPSRSAGGPPARRRRDRLSWLVPLAAALVTAVLVLLKLTTRRRYLNGEWLFAHWAGGGQVILAFWHEQLVMMPFPYTGRRAAIMVSRHRDGELIARAVRPLGIQAVRGSSTRGWSGGLKGLLRAYRGGADIAFVPDGPRGPRYVAKGGVVQMARATGAPIVPVAAAARWHHRIASWDRLIVPYPGSRLVYVAGEPLRVPADADGGALEAARAALERELTRLTEAAATAVRS
jgi:lysophospholipid acyltransferase (LPLAT)-like uncharacterized protein